MNNTNDYPLTRKTAFCALCSGPKDLGLVACWPCFRSTGMKYGNPAADEILDRFEASLWSMIAEGSLGQYNPDFIT